MREAAERKGHFRQENDPWLILMDGAETRHLLYTALMFTNSSEEWQRLAAHYGQMSEGELEELAEQINDLTELAQGVLRDELKRRGVDLPEAAAPKAVSGGLKAPVDGHQARIHFENPQSWRGPDGDADDGEAPAVEYTWKTPLAECNSGPEAWQLAEMLRRAGIDSWIDAAQSRSPKVMVAADQLEAAQRVAAQPIPQEIIDASVVPDEVEEFELPHCPACGAEDPILEAVEPVNAWSCESCGYEWLDEGVAAEE